MIHVGEAVGQAKCCDVHAQSRVAALSTLPATCVSCAYLARWYGIIEPIFPILRVSFFDREVFTSNDLIWPLPFPLQQEADALRAVVYAQQEEEEHRAWSRVSVHASKQSTKTIN